MKRTASAFLLFLSLVSTVSAQIFTQSDLDEDVIREGRNEYESMRSMDPLTQRIPENIHAKELKFAKMLPSASDLYKTSKAPRRMGTNWVARGPSNIGGRTAALGIDVSDTNIILAGGTSGGMYRSTDQGKSWRRTTPLAELPSVNCLAQDKRPGKTNIWYYGTGEFGGNTAGYPLWLNSGPYKWGDYYGNGIFKSEDNGKTWNVLASTNSDTIGRLVHPFNFVHEIVCDPSRTDQDIVYAATAGCIQRSTDGGATWSIVLGNFRDASAYTDIDVTSTGVLYATFGTRSMNWFGPSPIQGVFRSTDGVNWVDITPEGWKGINVYAALAIARSNENVFYVTGNLPGGSGNTQKSVLWKYTYLSGDGSAGGGTWEDRSANLDAALGTWVSCISVKPDDEHTVFVGGIYLVRSIDGFATKDKAKFMNNNLHVDMQSFAYFPGNPNRMLVGTDGGISIIENNLGLPYWNYLNDGFQTSQFYTIALDHATHGDPTIIGGLQDNFTNVTMTSDAAKPWTFLLGGDGATCAVADGRESYFMSIQWGPTYRQVLADNGVVMETARIDPVGSGEYLFINPFRLDPVNNDRIYLGGGHFLWRNNDVTKIPFGNNAPTAKGWDRLNSTTVTAIDTIVKRCLISTISVSERAPTNRVYFGTTDGQIFRIDDADKDQPTAVPIWKDRGLPASSYVASIAIDPRNADRALVAFANYNIQSLFYTTDAGSTWTPVSGNLEEHPDGKGNGPATRTVAIMPSDKATVYLVGTTTGLYSTSSLDGMSTTWGLEAENVIGNNIVNMVDTRPLDGTVAVATCGYGAFTGSFPARSSVNSEQLEGMSIHCSPNPVSSIAEIEVMLEAADNVTVTVHDLGGSEVSKLHEGQLGQGKHLLTWDATQIPQGSYYITLTSGARSRAAKVIITR